MRGVVEEHCGLLAHLAGKANARLDHEPSAAGTQALCQLVPHLPLEHHAEMGHGHLVTVDLIVMARCMRLWIKVCDELVAEEIKVDPFVRTAPLGASQRLAIECPRRGQIVHRNGKVKRLHGYGQRYRISCAHARGRWAISGQAPHGAGWTLPIAALIISALPPRWCAAAGTEVSRDARPRKCADADRKI